MKALVFTLMTRLPITSMKTHGKKLKRVMHLRQEDGLEQLQLTAKYTYLEDMMEKVESMTFGDSSKIKLQSSYIFCYFPLQIFLRASKAWCVVELILSNKRPKLMID